jgi:hypothetical protein
MPHQGLNNIQNKGVNPQKQTGRYDTAFDRIGDLN